jgi:ribosome maturation factor RimP
MGKLTDKIAELARPVVEQNGCELWDVEYVREAGANYLRVYVDKEGGVGIDDCERISRELDPLLDEADPIAESYIFEVGSAGCERQLKRPSDFQRSWARTWSCIFISPWKAAKRPWASSAAMRAAA